MADDIVYNAKEIVKALSEIEPGLKRALVKDSRDAAGEAISAIKSAIPKVNPFESKVRPVTNTRGRLGWGVGKKPDEVKFSFTTKGSRRSAVTALASLKVNSPATVLADTAGKGSGTPRRSVTNSYTWKGQTRSHRVTTQGRSMIRHLRSNRTNNFVYPGVEKSLPRVQAEIKLILEKYAAKVNRKLN